MNENDIIEKWKIVAMWYIYQEKLHIKAILVITLLFLPKKICKGKIKSFSVNTDTKISVPRFSNSLAAKTMTIRHKS